MVSLFTRLDQRQADDYHVVLSAGNIPHRLRATAGSWQIQVPVESRVEAQLAIARFLKENPLETAPSPHVSAQTAKPYLLSMYLCGLLAGVHLLIAHQQHHAEFVRAFGADALRIINGETYRCVTALCLHADAGHLLSNVVGLFIFGTAVATSAGAGVGWLSVLIAGSAGNLINAWWYRTGHISIGASTAVFAAVGWLACVKGIRSLAEPQQRKRALLSLAGGLALLGMLGASPHTDLMAHFFGFAAGCVMGAGYGLLFRTPLSPAIQWFSTFAAMGLIGGSFWQGY